MTSLSHEIRRELSANYGEPLSFLGVLRLLAHSRAWGIVLLRMAGRGSRIGRVLSAIVFHTEIAHGVSLGKSLWLPHPYGIVMAKGTEIGDNCAIYQRTTFAEQRGIHKGPKIGCNSTIGAGSVVLGDIAVGANVKIGPNSVVRADLPANVIAFGNPLVIKSQKEI